MRTSSVKSTSVFVTTLQAGHPNTSQRTTSSDTMLSGTQTNAPQGHFKRTEGDRIKIGLTIGSRIRTRASSLASARALYLAPAMRANQQTANHRQHEESRKKKK